MTISQSKIQQARGVDLVEYCEYKGFDMKYESDGNYRLPGYSGLIIKDNFFKQFGSNKKGNSIDFCVDILGMEFRAAVKELLSFGNENKKDGRTIPIANAIGAGLKRKNVCVLPTMAPNNQKVIDYLTKRRGIPEKLVNELINGGLLYQDSRNNSVFTCYDQSGQAKGAILRGTLADKPFKGRSKGSDVDYGWLLAPEKESSQVIIVEAPIDAMSMIALYDEKSVRSRYLLALGGLHESAVKRFLETHTGVDTIILAVDNDVPATEFINKIKNSFGFAYHIKEFRPEGKKDWNELLLAS